MKLLKSICDCVWSIKSNDKNKKYYSSVEKPVGYTS